MFVQDSIDSDNNDFTDFRVQAFEVVRDFEPCLRASSVMMQVHVNQMPVSALMMSHILSRCMVSFMPSPVTNRCGGA